MQPDSGMKENPAPLNAMTIDVEDYFMVSAFSKVVRFEEWGKYESRIERSTSGVLDIFDEYDVKATFFVLGWVAERNPALVRQIHSRGHEVGSHGYSHRLAYEMSPGEFRKDARKSKQLIEDIIGRPVKGYRAASYSVTKKSLWALDVLIEEGFEYDSSIFPVVHDIYGIPGASRFPHIITRPSGVITEFPISTVEIKALGLKASLPIAGGGYLRLLPAWLIKKCIDHVNAKEKQPAVIYLHPWEIDPGQPRINAGLKSRFRHYVNLDRTASKLRYLLSSTSFRPMEDVLAAVHLGENLGRRT